MTELGIDRAEAVRRALIALVARHGFHGASMGAVAREAGVATGTAYTHYTSKDELVLAAYAAVKATLGTAACADADPARPPSDRFRAIWLAAYRHLAANREHALFLLQADASPYRDRAHEAARANGGDALLAQAVAADMAALLLPLPAEVLYELGLAPAVRLAAAGTSLSEDELELAAAACWRAITAAEA